MTNSLAVTFMEHLTPHEMRMLDALYKDIQRKGSERLTTKKENALIAAYQDGDVSAGQRVINSKLAYIFKLVAGIKGAKPFIFEGMTEGTIAAMNAMKNFNTEHGVWLSTYIKPFVIHAVMHAMRKEERMVTVGDTNAMRRINAKMHDALEHFERESTLTGRPDPSRKDLAEFIGVDEADINAWFSKETISLSKPVARLDDETPEVSRTMNDVIPGDDPTPEAVAEERDRIAALRLLFERLGGRLTDVERLFLANKLREEPLTLVQLSEEEDVPYAALSLARKNILRRLRSALASSAKDMREAKMLLGEEL